MHGMSCFALSALAVGLAGCSAAACRPDADVAGAVEREDRRRAQPPPQQARRPETTSESLDPIRLWWAAVEAITLLYVPGPEAGGTGAASVPTTGGVAAWLAKLKDSQPARPRPTKVGPEWERSFRSDVWERVELAAVGARSEPSAEREPRIRLQFLSLRLNGAPVTVAASMRGPKAVQFRVKIRL